MTKKSPLGTILLVEDDFVLRTALANLLEAEGYLVDCAASGLEAFHALNSGSVKPSVIVLDLMMPYMDGLEFRALQRSLPSVAHVPVVVITASRQIAPQAEQLEVKKTIFKPLNTSALIETIDELVREEAVRQDEPTSLVN